MAHVISIIPDNQASGYQPTSTQIIRGSAARLAAQHRECQGRGELETALLRNKYREAIADSFKAAAQQLGERERLVLVLRFEDEMAATEIAQLLGVHPSQITRTVKLAQVKFRTTVLERLSTHHGLGREAIEECLAEICGSHDLSVVSCLRLAERLAQATEAARVPQAVPTSLLSASSA